MGKGGGAKASLVDPSAAMASYQKAADVIEKQFPIALAQFQSSAASGLAAQLDQYGKASAESAPFSQTAKDAVNELRFMLGMAKTSDSLGLADQVGALADSSKSWQDTTGVLQGGVTEMLRNIQTKMSNAELLSNPTERAAAKQGILDDVQNATNRIYNERVMYGQQRWGSTYGDTALRPVDTAADGTRFGSASDYGMHDLTYAGTNLSGATRPEVGSAQDILENKDWLALQDIHQKLSQYGQEFEAKYSLEPNKAPTAQQVMDKLTSTPGYQANLQQGEQSLSRSQAARGILQSGNGALEAAKFGADYATAAYQQQIGNLANLAGINMPVTQQQIGNTTQLGNNLQNQYNLTGQTAQTSMQDIARSRESAFIRSGDAQLQAAMMNAQLKTQASMQNAAQGASMMGGIGSLAGQVLGMVL